MFTFWNLILVWHQTNNGLTITNYCVFNRKQCHICVLALMPYVRQNFPNFSFSRVSEMFGCQSSEIFRKKNRIFELAKFLRKFGNLSSEKSSGINWNCTSISKFLKNLHKVWVFESKTLFLGQKVWKKFGNRVFWILQNFGNCFIPKFLKITKKWY